MCFCCHSCRYGRLQVKLFMASMAGSLNDLPGLYSTTVERYLRTRSNQSEPGRRGINWSQPDRVSSQPCGHGFHTDRILPHVEYNLRKESPQSQSTLINNLSHVNDRCILSGCVDERYEAHTNSNVGTSHCDWGSNKNWREIWSDR